MCLFIWFTGFYFPLPVDRMVSELSTMTQPSWVALHDHQVTHRFTELRVPLRHNKAVIQEGKTHTHTHTHILNIYPQTLLQDHSYATNTSHQGMSHP